MGKGLNQGSIKESIGHSYSIVLIHKNDMKRLKNGERLEDLRLANHSVIGGKRLDPHKGSIIRIEQDEMYQVVDTISYLDFELDREVLVVSVIHLDEAIEYIDTSDKTYLKEHGPHDFPCLVTDECRVVNTSGSEEREFSLSRCQKCDSFHKTDESHACPPKSTLRPFKLEG